MEIFILNGVSSGIGLNLFQWCQYWRLLIEYIQNIVSALKFNICLFLTRGQQWDLWTSFFIVVSVVGLMEYFSLLWCQQWGLFESFSYDVSSKSPLLCWLDLWVMKMANNNWLDIETIWNFIFNMNAISW